METQLEYVRRKLNEPQCNVSSVANKLSIKRYRLDKIAKGGDVKYSVIEMLYIHFKNSAS
jgi:hypothetical protein